MNNTNITFKAISAKRSRRGFYVIINGKRITVPVGVSSVTDVRTDEWFMVFATPTTVAELRALEDKHDR